MRALPIISFATLVWLPIAAHAGQTIDQKDKQFSQTAVTVQDGDAVTFSNSDQVAHDLSIRNPDGSKMMSRLERPGEAANITFDKPGDYKVQCLIHPRMKAVVTVK